jgi:hypothetical protein
MKVRIGVQESTYFIKLLLIFSNIPPFNKVRPKELELYAHLLEINHRYRNIPFKERNRLIFSYETKVELSDKMGMKMNGIYNILSNLKLAKVIGDSALLPKYTFNKVNELTFIFDDED